MNRKNIFSPPIIGRIINNQGIAEENFGLWLLGVYNEFKNEKLSIFRKSVNSDYTTSGETLISCNQTSSITIILSGEDTINGKIIIVKDESGNATTNFIVVKAEDSRTIDGAVNKSITTNYGSFIFYSDGSNWFTL